MILWREMSWWLWAANATLLIAGLVAWPAALWLGLGLALAQVLFFWRREGALRAFPVQVRVGYALILAIGMWPSMRWLLWVPAIGTPAQVLLGYCLLARVLSLAPWNRRETLSGGLVWRTFVSRPVRGNILQGLPAAR